MKVLEKEREIMRLRAGVDCWNTTLAVCVARC